MRVIVRSCQWGRTTSAPPVNEAHVYVANPDSLPCSREELQEQLTPDERDRAARYRAGTVREQFIAGRGLLRRLLGDCLGVSPHVVPITYILNGKPVLVDSPLHFNVSHTNGLALIAIAHRRVGVDVECRRIIPDADGLVGRFFSKVEQHSYRALPGGIRHDAFYRGWVCKEAVIKAAGASVQYLDGFDVELNPLCPPGVLAVRHSALAGEGWAVADWEPAPGFAAAIALESSEQLEIQAGS